MKDIRFLFRRFKKQNLRAGFAPIVLLGVLVVVAAAVIPVSQIINTQSTGEIRQQAAVDNCCQIGWECKDAIRWQEGYFAYQQGRCGVNVQIPAPPANQPSADNPPPVPAGSCATGTAKLCGGCLSNTCLRYTGTETTRVPLDDAGKPITCNALIDQKCGGGAPGATCAGEGASAPNQAGCCTGLTLCGNGRCLKSCSDTNQPNIPTLPNCTTPCVNTPGTYCNCPHNQCAKVQANKGTTCGGVKAASSPVKNPVTTYPGSEICTGVGEACVPGDQCEETTTRTLRKRCGDGKVCCRPKITDPGLCVVNGRRMTQSDIVCKSEREPYQYRCIGAGRGDASDDTGQLSLERQRCPKDQFCISGRCRTGCPTSFPYTTMTACESVNPGKTCRAWVSGTATSELCYGVDAPRATPSILTQCVTQCLSDWPSTYRQTCFHLCSNPTRNACGLHISEDMVTSSMNAYTRSCLDSNGRLLLYCIHDRIHGACVGLPKETPDGSAGPQKSQKCGEDRCTPGQEVCMDPTKQPPATCDTPNNDNCTCFNADGQPCNDDGDCASAYCSIPAGQRQGTCSPNTLRRSGYKPQACINDCMAGAFASGVVLRQVCESLCANQEESLCTRKSIPDGGVVTDQYNLNTQGCLQVDGKLLLYCPFGKTTNGDCAARRPGLQRREPAGNEQTPPLRGRATQQPTPQLTTPTNPGAIRTVINQLNRIINRSDLSTTERRTLRRVVEEGRQDPGTVNLNRAGQTVESVDTALERDQTNRAIHVIRRFFGLSRETVRPTPTPRLKTR